MKPSLYLNDEYTIGWISPSSEELMVAMAMLDEEHGRPQSTPRDDTNAYHLGKIGEHNIAMACLSGGQTGTGPAAIVAENMRRTFRNIRFALLVGTGGGLPSKKKDIRLGDVVVSYPTWTYSGIVQYDYGKLKTDGHVQRKDSFCAPPRKVLAAVDLLRAYHARPKKPINNMLSIIDELGEEYAYPEEHIAPDLLYQADYEHDPEAETCDSCDKEALVPRNTRSSPCKPYVHYGVIASGNMVVNSGVERDKIDQRYENSILCFEMEAAGLMNNFPCLLIRGIGNYSDSHKNDQWQKRATAVASAYAKELLLLIEPSDIEILPPIVGHMLDTETQQQDLRIREPVSVILVYCILSSSWAGSTTSSLGEYLSQERRYIPTSFKRE
ncbi:purine and uridine phosphorylase [Aspergillus novoparasiticus]|uniref:Purine and uridine phosphorylase n=1 Tax=Aspergillus novoparasiticus TaxID=986946 RepID=A0A5N6EHX6_9EURO|nr:purine and uridine phosphorylase [Aspergillus novoparasiticus]